MQKKIGKKNFQENFFCRIFYFIKSFFWQFLFFGENFLAKFFFFLAEKFLLTQNIFDQNICFDKKNFWAENKLAKKKFKQNHVTGKNLFFGTNLVFGEKFFTGQIFSG